MSRYFRNGIVLAVALLAPELTLAASITVNTATDDFGSVTSNCSLREAIQTANTNADFGGCTHTGIFNAAVTDVINLPTLGAGGFFTLTRIGTDDNNNSGDLDIAGLLRIEGASTANSVIRGDTTDPDSDRHRLVHVISGTVTLNDLTLRDGLEDGTTAGGGLRTEPGSTTILNRVAVLNNSAGGNAGGILNRGTMTLNESTVRANRTTDAGEGGGGIFNSPNAVLTLNDSRVLDNVAEVADDAFECQGGGIYNAADAVLTLDNSVVDGNIADGRQLAFTQAFGGGIRAGGTVDLIQSSVTNNLAAGETAEGGGIFFLLGSTGLIDRSVVAFNVADDRNVLDTSAGGGINSRLGFATIQDSVISGNEAEAGGGLHGRFRILRSTVANNRAQGDVNDSRGGGITITGASEIVNTTIIGNTTDRDGGGIHFGAASSTTRVLSSTIVANASDRNGGGVDVGGGNFTLANTVLAGNSAGNAGAECSGTLVSDGNNLVQATAGCGFVATAGDRTGVAAGLAPVASNGGPIAGSSLGIISAMQTRVPLPTSLLVDAGAANGCTDANGQQLPTDQIGRARAIDGPDADTTARCDIGAIEFVDAILEDSFE